MAILKDFKIEYIEYLRGDIDIYFYRGQLCIARKWPRKIKPPYSEAQKLSQLVFTASREDISQLSDRVVSYWRKWDKGVGVNWTDDFTGLYMRFWKFYKQTPVFLYDFKIKYKTDTFSMVFYWKRRVEFGRKEYYSKVEVLPDISSSILQNKKMFYIIVETQDHIRVVAPPILL